MDALVIYPENKEQLLAVKAVMKAMKIAFEQKVNIYPEHVLNGVKKSLQQAEEGELKPYTSVRDMIS